MQSVGGIFRKKSCLNFGRKYFVMLVPLFLILGLAVSGAAGYLSIASDTKKSTESVLIDSAHEQVLLLRAKIDSQLAALKFVASSIPKSENLSSPQVSQITISAVRNSEFDIIAVALPNGVIYDASGFADGAAIHPDHLKKQ